MSESHLEFYRRWHSMAKPYFRWQFEQFRPFLGKRVADIGCGLGNLTAFMADRELYIGFDPDALLLNELKGRYKDRANIEIYEGDVLEHRCIEYLKNKHTESIICINVLEHIEDDHLAIRNMADALPAGGTLCLLVPAGPSIFGSLDRLDHHFRRYAKKELEGKLKASPLEILKLYHFNAIGALGWWWKGKVMKEKRQTNSDYKIMNLLIPVMSKLEAACPPPFGLSLVAVARRL